MAENATLLHTPLSQLHRELGARMVPFAGYEMPVQYPTGVLKEHAHTRAQAGLFDVSHMGQVELHGPEAAAGLETLVPVDVLGLPPGRQRYGFFTNEAGGIDDDLMIFNAGSHLHLVVNAACKAKDIALLRERLGRRCEIRVREDLALLALQGPAAEAALRPLAEGALPASFMHGARLRLAGIDCWVTRSGYTGEDGFEISVPTEAVERLARALLAQPAVAPAGLGARDSLRLEAGLCLYGHDLDAVTSPAEAALAWAIPKVRRSGGTRAGGFPGAERILAELDDPSRVVRRRVGLKPEGRAPIREGVTLIDSNGREIGRVTSGGFGPSLNAPIAMGYVETAYAAVGTELAALVRGAPIPVRVVELPFVPHRYQR
ncbi:MAG: glycine cleavage system aminomethyltransferase GcvT [Casimicrobiaceae bacterium]|nr:glycine cleavage system aminomethyltransferase GcvT [Casimicrobiaceae bacterium]MDW8312760.1 glycine cleavage system aminomethyltransferase GcvT [Burkholderiales bacterium]